MKRLFRLISTPAIVFVLILSLFLPTCRKPAEISDSRWVTSTDGLRLRSAPGIAGGQIALIPHAAKIKLIAETGDTVSVSGTQGKWAEVEWEGKKGFVFGGFLSEREPVLPDPGSDESLIEFAKKHYVGKYDKEYRAAVPSAAAGPSIFSRDIRIKKRMGDFVVLEHNGFFGGPDIVEKQDGLWVWRDNSWRIVVDGEGWGGKCELLKLNDDDFPDAVYSVSVSDGVTMRLYLGTGATEMKHMPKSGASYYETGPEDITITYGKCGGTKIITKGNETFKGTEITFNCAKNSFVTSERN